MSFYGLINPDPQTTVMCSGFTMNVTMLGTCEDDAYFSIPVMCQSVSGELCVGTGGGT